MQGIAWTLAILAFPGAAAARQWEPLGASAAGGGISSSRPGAGTPSVAVDSRGYPVVAWIEGPFESAGRFGSQVYLRQWNGTAWVELGGSASSTGVSNSSFGAGVVQVGVAPNGNPVVSWLEDRTGLELADVHLRSWDGTAWVELGESATGGGVSRTAARVYDMRMAVDTSGRPAVVWLDDYVIDGMSFRFRVYCRQWDGASWTELGGSATDEGISQSIVDCHWPDVTFASDGLPCVSWQTYDVSGAVVYLRKWDGVRWAGLGGSASVGGISSGTGEAVGYSKIAAGPAGRLAVAWQGSAKGGDYAVYLRAWNPLSQLWEELGGSARGAGVSQTARMSCLQPSVTWGPTGLSVAWWAAQVGDSAYRVYLRHWGGSVWEELGGSATGDGISVGLDGETGAILPAIAADGRGRTAAVWQQTGAGTDVYLRVWDDLLLGLVSPDQVRSDGVTPLPIGGWSGGGEVTLVARVEHKLGGPVRLEVEVQPAGTAFTGTPTTSASGTAGATLSCAITGLSEGKGYHWQARGFDPDDLLAGVWIPFGDNGVQADFIFGSPPPAGGGEGSGGKDGGGCGGAGRSAGMPAIGILLALAVVMPHFPPRPR